MKEITHLIHAKLTALIRDHQLFSPHEKMVIGVSGGTDSLALAHILADLHPKLQIQIHIATFNHGLRPRAEAETYLVQQFADSLSIPCTVGRGDVLALQQAEKLSLEEAARKARYQFLADVAQTVGAKTIVTAHHQDDQAETVLFHLARGTGGAGAVGMRLVAPFPLSNSPELRLVRPLLTITRAELEIYCQENGLIPVDDESNADVTITRNAIRHQVMPLLQRINPQVAGALSRFAQIYADEQDVLQHIFEQTILSHVNFVDGRFFIPRNLFIQWHIAFQRKILHHLLAIADVTYDQIAHAIKVAHMGKNGAIAQFPKGWQLRVIYDDLVLENRSLSPTFPNDIPLLPQNTAILLDFSQIYDFGHWQFQMIHPPDKQASTKLYIPNESRVILRTRLPKDRFAPLGMNGSHVTIKDWMINRKIPQALRAHIPLLVVDDQIAMILWGENFVAHIFAIIGDNKAIWDIFINVVTNKTG